MMPIKKYSLIVVHSPQELVDTVTRACAKGFIPVGGVAMAWEPADPKRQRPAAQMAYCQAMILPIRVQDTMGLFVDKEPGVAGMILDGAGNPAPSKIVGGPLDGAEA